MNSVFTKDNLLFFDFNTIVMPLLFFLITIFYAKSFFTNKIKSIQNAPWLGKCDLNTKIEK